MKKLIILAVICIASQANGHNLSYEHLSLKTWNIVKEHRVVEGSFCVFKDNEVYVENLQKKWREFPCNL